jgi:hydrogenase expression/formation protein HypC
MCLAFPAKIESIFEGVDAIANYKGLNIKVHIELVPDVKVGDYVLIHAGFAIQIIDKNDAVDILSLFEEAEKNISNVN